MNWFICKDSNKLIGGLDIAGGDKYTSIIQIYDKGTLKFVTFGNVTDDNHKIHNDILDHINTIITTADISCTSSTLNTDLVLYKYFNVLDGGVKQHPCTAVGVNRNEIDVTFINYDNNTTYIINLSFIFFLGENRFISLF